MVSNRPADSPIAIVEGMNHFKSKGVIPCPGQFRQLFIFIQRNGLIVPIDKPRHFHPAPELLAALIVNLLPTVRVRSLFAFGEGSLR